MIDKPNLITVDTDYNRLETKAHEDLMNEKPTKNQTVAADLLAASVAKNHNPTMPTSTVTTKGSEAYLDEKEQRLQTLLDEATAVKNLALDEMNRDLESHELDANDILTRLSSLDHDISVAKETVSDIATLIGAAKSKIDLLNKEIATLNARRQSVLSHTMPSLTFERSQQETKLAAIRKAADDIRGKHSKRVETANKEHEKLRMRLLRVQLRKPKTVAATPTKTENGLYTMPSAPDEGNA